uniref:Uncharacterized protein n=1 Tax=Thermogemmatispora argillosa TaxID=2045280 RepID=A0A455SYS0_9CHLR|nr:hypothetical protein KTA_09350 [Thermogemmatispora argillosa]
MSILESIQHGLEKAAQQAARLARIQHLQLVLNDLSYKASVEHRTLSNKVMELYFNGQLAQSELLPLCQNLATLEQHIKEIQQELDRLHGEGQEEEASASPSAAPSPPVVSGPVPGSPAVASNVAPPPAAYPSNPVPGPTAGAVYPNSGAIVYPPAFGAPLGPVPNANAGYAVSAYGSPAAAMSAAPVSDGTTLVTPPSAPESAPPPVPASDPVTATAPVSAGHAAPSNSAAGGVPAPATAVPPWGALPESALGSASPVQPWQTTNTGQEEGMRGGPAPEEPDQPQQA